MHKENFVQGDPSFTARSKTPTSNRFSKNPGMIMYRCKYSVKISIFLMKQVNRYLVDFNSITATLIYIIFTESPFKYLGKIWCH
jgi:hypothetical protein